MNVHSEAATRRDLPAITADTRPATEPTVVVEHVQPSGRFAGQLRLLGILGWLWLVGFLHAATWLWAVGLAPRASSMPWMHVVLPQMLALLLVGGSLVSDLPDARWPSPAGDRRQLRWILLLGWPAAPLVAWSWWRERRRPVAAAPPDPEAIEAAFARLLDLPRTIALRFVGWGALAYVVDAIVLGLHERHPPDVVVAIAIVWIAILGPLAATLHGWSRAILRPEYLSVPRRSTPAFVRTGELRPRLFVAAAAATAGAIAAPLAAGYLWINAIGPTPSLAPLLFAAGGACLVCCLVALATLVVDVHRDVTRAGAQVAAVADGRAPPPLSRGSFATHEIRQLVQAVDGLVQRITEANVAKYVAIERAKEADRLKSQFLANMSHDLRSPLNSIIGFSELLLSGIEGPLSAEQRDLIKTIHGGGKHLLQQIDEILDTAKLEASRLDLHPEPTPPANLLSRAIQNARARKPDVEYVTDVAAGLPVVFVDSYRAVQALENVLVFAGERIENGRLQITARPGRHHDRRVVFVRVATPFKPATADQLAQARRGFTRIAGHRGLGLGLPLAGAILELSGGSLAIEELGESMVFTLQLPAPEARRRRGTEPRL